MFFHQISYKARDRSRAGSWWLALAAAAALSVASLSGARAANASPVSSTSITFLSGNATFRVGGHTWNVTVSSVSGTVHFAEIGIATGHELDTWDFSPSPSPLSVNQRTGDATFNAHNSFAPIAFVKLTFTTTKRGKASCTSGSETNFSGKVSGSLTLIANNRGLKFKSAHVRFTGGSLSIDHDCVPHIAPSPCAPGTWGIGSSTVNAAGTAQSLAGQRNFVVSIFDTVSLKAPKGATMGTNLVGSSNKPVFNSSKKTLQVSAHGVVSGSALMKASGPPAVNTFSCVLGGKHFTAHDATYSASFASPSGGQFQARSIVAGLLKAPRSGSSLFDIVTLKAA